MKSSLLLLTLLVAPLPLVSAHLVDDEDYRLPPPEVVELVDALSPPSLSISPDGRWALGVEPDTLPSIADVSRPMLRLAGLRIDPTANARHRSSFNRGLFVRDLTSGEETHVLLPMGSRLVGARWSHTSRHFAYTTLTASGTSLWVARVSTPRAAFEASSRISSVLGSGYQWSSDGASLIVTEVPAKRGTAPTKPLVPTGPNVRETSGSSSPLRTYQDLLSSGHDEALFEYYATSELNRIDLSNGQRTPVGSPALYSSFSSSPDGGHLLVTTIQRPFSYLMPAYLFGQNVEVWDAEGQIEKRVASIPIAEGIPLHGVRTGSRSIGWRPGHPATLVWTEALDGGDPKKESPHRDRCMLAEPFDGEVREAFRTKFRLRGISWLQDGQRALVREYDRDRRWNLTWLRDIEDPAAKPRLMEDRSSNDRYGDPGSPLTLVDASGDRLVRVDGPWIHRSGRGAGPAGARPFLDRQNLETLKSERLWQCEEKTYESVAALIDVTATGPVFMTRRETASEPPNYRLHSGNKVRALTDYADPTPQLRGITKQLVTYERADGVALSSILYLPAGYEEGTRLPLVVWAYPREFSDPKTAGQVGGSPHRFTRIGGSSHLFFLTQGYAIMDAATMPVIGDAETMNDTFIEQIVAAAQAAIDKAVEMGVADPTRVGVGGHSYGAFMTANLLAHCDLFSAGVARSGAYNRTLTPFGFQSERRTLWEAPEIYFAISPFMHADKINEPILLLHGEIDNNSGTFPVQSSRLYQGIKGNGGTARLVYLPNESHGYRARESVLHTLAEMIDWFDKYVKGSKP
ncbi:MAG TPA: S9 family peptidase [Planctomycetes bacterium]|nr:S9 family peptidase [Planctomycetota bacterium]HIL35882.1 S9 family peptidase [Planctomycetota bacterium]